MKLSLERIKNQVTAEIFERGERLFRDNKVKLFHIDIDKFEAEIEAAHTYTVTVQEIGENLYSRCSCPYWTTCKHVVAALLQAREWYDENGGEMQLARTHPSWKKFLDKISDLDPDANAHHPAQQWRVVYFLDLNGESWSLTPKKAYVKKNQFLGRFVNLGRIDLNSRELIYSPNDPIVVSFIQKRENQNYSFYNNRFFGNSQYKDTQIFHYKYGSRLGPLFDLLQESQIYIGDYEDQLAPIRFSPVPAAIHMELQKMDGSFHLIPSVHLGDDSENLNPSFKILTEQPIWLLKDQVLHKVENLQNAALLIPFTKSNITLEIPETDFPAFFESFYARLRDVISLPLPDSLQIERITSISEKRIYLEESERHLQIFLRFAYRTFEVAYADRDGSSLRQDGDKIVEIVRDRDAEDLAWQRLLRTGLKEETKGGLSIIDTRALQWLFSYLPELVNDGFVFYGRENLQRYHIRTGTPNVRVAVSSNIDWFDVNIEIDIEGIALALKELRRAVRQNVRYVRLADQSIAQLPEEWLQKFRYLLNVTASQDDQIKASPMHITLIDTLFEDAQSFKADAQYYARLKQLSSFEGISPQTVPPSLVNILRNYQKSGYDWLYFLRQYSFGGCLADDMGLGKTVQTLALLLNEKQQGNTTPSLIVCPTSVVFNWEKEVQKFTPELKVLVHTGLQRSRNATFLDGYDVILTSYGIMRRDILFLREFGFHYVILDESQKIKNPLSQTAKAARLLRSQFRLVLTGTPVENNTVELWSQFSFLNPGMLGSLKYFKTSFTLPIEKRRDGESARILRKLVFPFILRRTKEGVAQELPPKIEQTFFCTMSPAQEKLYSYWRDFYRAMLLNKIDLVGIESSHMNILEGLVKLRQLACHPYLIDHSVIEDSGKFESLKEFIEEIIAENHKVLIFSQFVKMLRLIRRYLDDNNISYEYLDGHTTNRMEKVDHFQNDTSVRIFLISLKAGGVGLNLTAADYVIHYDPWWNPAVEVQATDRAHRIGQEKKVFVYRLITRGTVEEKMLELQSQKQQLVQDLISTDSSFFKNLSRDDIELLFS